MQRRSRKSQSSTASRNRELLKDRDGAIHEDMQDPFVGMSREQIREAIRKLIRMPVEPQ